MYSVAVRSHFMIAHSFRGDVFGPAQRLHGATYTVEARLSRRELDPDGIVVDIGRFHETLKGILDRLNFRNLDDEADFRGQNTTTEYLAGVIHQRLVAAIGAGALGQHTEGLRHLEVALHESPDAWASYAADIAP